MKRSPIQPIDPDHPQPRHIARAVAVLEAGGLIAYPTDTYYGIGCDLFQKKAHERLVQLKRRDEKKPFAILCADLSEIIRQHMHERIVVIDQQHLLAGARCIRCEG